MPGPKIDKASSAELRSAIRGCTILAVECWCDNDDVAHQRVMDRINELAAELASRTPDGGKISKSKDGGARRGVPHKKVGEKS